MNTIKLINKYSKAIVALVILLNVLFAIVVLCLMGFFQMPEPTTLIKYWYIFTGTELLSVAGIKITDTVTERKRGCIDNETMVNG